MGSLCLHQEAYDLQLNIVNCRNVNGIRNPFSYQPWNTARTFPAMFDILGSDIVVMQELKIQRKDLRDDMVMLEGWDCYFSLPKHKKGYSGVGIYTRNATCAPIRAEEGVLGVLPSPSGVPYCELPDDQSIGGYPNALQVAELGVDPAALDAEGRCLLLEFPAFVLLGVYSPANSNGLRDDFRYGFICALDCRIRNLVRLGKRVVLVGDLNVSRDETDTAGAADDIRKSGLTHEDYISTPNRRIFNQLLIGGEVVGEQDEGREQGVLWDTSRAFHPERKGMYTHWEQKVNARPGNYGSRIDYVLVSEGMRSWVKDANIQEGLLGSDHCPVFADFNETVEMEGEVIHLSDLMSPPGVFGQGARRQEWKLQSVPPFSAKRLPEFERRRSIKSMFGAPALSKAQSSKEEQPSAKSHEDYRAQQTPLATEGEHAVDVARSLSKPASEAAESKPSPLKRSASSRPAGNPPKRSKANSGLSSTKGQQSLKGFFQKKSSGPNESAESKTPTDTSPFATPINVSEANGAEYGEPGDKTAITTSGEPATPSASAVSTSNDMQEYTDTSPSKLSAIIAGAEQNQKSWNTLFSRPVAPMCEGHVEPCKTMQTKKKGSNQGRSFWMCARPLGPSGQKEKGTQWRCATFIWCSDWTPRREETSNGRSPGG